VAFSKHSYRSLSTSLGLQLARNCDLGLRHPFQLEPFSSHHKYKVSNGCPLLHILASRHREASCASLPIGIFYQRLLRSSEIANELSQMTRAIEFWQPILCQTC
jgi:hypothetical protein